MVKMILEIKSFTEDEKLTLNFVNEVSKKYAKDLELHFLKIQNERIKKKNKQKKFLTSSKSKKKSTRETLKPGLIPQMISQAIRKGIPLREPKRKRSSQPELTPLIYQTIEQSELVKRYPIDESADFKIQIKDIDFVPDMIYLQRLDASNSKMLVKMVVNWGYLEDNMLDKFLNEKDEEIAENKILVFKDNKKLHGIFPLKHSSNFQDDSEETAKALFVGLITDLQSNSKYWYRIECYDKKTKKQFAATNMIEFRTSFNLSEANNPLFLTVSSDLHGGRNAKFMRGKVKGKSITGNLDLAKVFNCITSSESEVTFGEGYTLAITTGDLTENASYSEYWVDLFKRCSVLWDHVPLLTCIGNHDYYSGGRGRGNMIGGFEEDCRYWHRYVTNPNSSFGNLPEHWYSIDQGNIHAIFLDSNGMGWGKYNLDCKSEQWLWLEQDLKNWRERVNKGDNAPQFCFVFLHSAIMSLGFWGRGFNNGNDEKVQSYLTPLFRKYGVDMVFHGHDHIYQRSNWLGTTYIVNGRHGGTTRPFFYWKRKKAVYDIERVCKNWKTRIYTTVYIPPNKQFFTNKQESEFQDFNNKTKKELMNQPIASNYFFGISDINQKIGRLLDKNEKLKEKFIEELILPKLEDHIWLRAYAIEEGYHIGKREMIDMCFLKAKDPNKFKKEQYVINCPEKVVE
ncbi:MAG: hypothetical protein FK730_04865 [Asgard group archaeon]|nr:hypothetical protein [Asgard group archaeon]